MFVGSLWVAKMARLAALFEVSTPRFDSEFGVVFQVEIKQSLIRTGTRLLPFGREGRRIDADLLA
jgi:hypothetical protein